MSLANKIRVDYIPRLKQSALAKDSFWALLGSAIGKGLALVAGIVVARFLGKEVYGEYGTIRTTLTYIAIVSTFGFGYSATKFVAEYIMNKQGQLRSLVNKITRTTIVFSFCLTIVLAVFADRIAVFIDAPQLADTLRWFSLLIVFNALTSTQIAILSGFKSFKRIAQINTLSGIVTFVASIVLTYFWNLNGAVGALMLSFIVQAVLNCKAIQSSLSAYEPTSTVDRRDYSKMLKFSIPIALQDGLYTVVHWLSLLLLIKYSNYGEVGLLSAASLWQSMVIFIPAMLKNVMFSYLSSSFDHKRLVNNILLPKIRTAC